MYMGDKLCNDYIRELIEIDPTINDILMKKEYDHLKHIQPNIYSEDYYSNINKLNHKYVNLLKKKETMSFYDKILFRDLKHEIDMEEKYEIYMYMPVDIADNILIYYVSESRGEGTYSFENKDDYLFFMERLKTLDDITEEIIIKMRAGIKNKITLYEKIVDFMINQIDEILEEKRFIKPRSYSIKNWDKSLEKYLIGNLTKFNDFLKKEYKRYASKKMGLSSYKGGDKAYTKILQDHTFSNTNPEKVHKLGLDELKILIKKKKIIEDNLDIDKLNKEKLTKNDDIINKLIEIREDINENLVGKLFNKGKLKENELYDVKEVSISDKLYSAFYISPTHKKGIFYINMETMKPIHSAELYILSLHEGIPGHHYESYRHNGVNDYLKLNTYSGYSEGWGLYCESIGEKTIEREYYRLNYEIHRTLRLIIDTGIHYYNWSYDKCLNLMNKHLDNRKTIENEILRLVSLPGQAITYKIGEKTMVHLKDNILKDKSLKDFHDSILDIGPCPLELLLKYYIDKKL